MYRTLLKYHPVGQGCFYTGQLYSGRHRLFNFVYDCGTNSEQEYLREEITNSTIKKRTGSKINVCIISHFHYDHTSGIPQLLKDTPCDRLIIPYYELVERLIIYLESGSTDDDYRRMMEDPLLYFSSDQFDISQIIVIGGGPEDQSPEPRRPVAPGPNTEFLLQDQNKDLKADIYYEDWDDDGRNQAFYQQLTQFEPSANLPKLSFKTMPYQLRTPLYQFIFYCRTMKDGSDADARLKMTELRKYINDYYNKEKARPKSSVKELKDLFNAEHIKEITRIYTAIFGGTGKLNGTSLAVYHQSMIGAESYVPLRYLGIRFRLGDKRDREMGSMMTGDLDLDTKEKLDLFQDYYQHYLKYVGYFQVMHHGSDKNWPFGKPTSKLHTFPAYIINHGAGSAHHPGKEVGKLLRRKCPMHVYLNNEFTSVDYGYHYIRRRSI